MNEETVSSEQSIEGRVDCAHAELDVSQSKSLDNPKPDVESQATAKQSLTVPPEESQTSSPTPQVSQKTRGVRPPRIGRAEALKDAAKKAAQSNSRSDVHEYMRLRRNYV